jgi:hypothetical protein
LHLGGIDLKFIEYLLFNPQKFLNIASNFLDKGTWAVSEGGSNFKGIRLMIVWQAEAALYLLAVAYHADDVARRPFSESRGVWLPSIFRVFPLPGAAGEAKAIADSVKAGDFGFFQRSAPADASHKGPSLSLILYAAQEAEEAYATVAATTFGDGKEKRHETLIRCGRLPYSQAQAILAVMKS